MKTTVERIFAGFGMIFIVAAICAVITGITILHFRHTSTVHSVLALFGVNAAVPYESLFASDDATESAVVAELPQAAAPQAGSCGCPYCCPVEG